MSLNLNLSNNLKAIRRSRALSISEFAEELCIARSSLQNILNGESNPRIDTVEQIADRLNTDAVTLLQDQYSSTQHRLMPHILVSIETFSKLSEEDRNKAYGLFHQLLILLDSAKTKNR